MYEVSVVTVDKRLEKHTCKSVDEVLKLLDGLNDDEVSSVAIRRLEKK